MSAICVFCSSSTEIDAHYVDLAARVGERIARDGHTLVSGGGRISMMGAVARAARDGGTTTTGIIPHGLRVAEIADNDSTELLFVQDMRIRKAEMDRRSDAFLVLPGGLGTLEEFFEIWVGRMLRFHHKPVVVLDPDGFYAGLRSMTEQMRDRRFVRPGAFDAVTWAADLDAAFTALAAVPEPGPAPSPGDVAESQP